MSGYGIAAVSLAAAIIVGMGIFVLAGSFAVTNHPGRLDAERNARRYVVPAGIGFVLALAGVVGLIVLALIAALDWLTP